MVTDSLILPECIYRPGSFTGLMTLYESNYIRLSHLVSQLETLSVTNPEPALSSSPRDRDLYLQVRSRERYTSTLKLTYWFADGENRPVADPDLTVRVYHDARLVEAVDACREHYHQKLRELARTHSHELNRRWRNNMMLNKWLDYLLDMGHGFAGLPTG
jgi:uncharacterized protein YqiB (DUF1249 family)